jgi:CheY-like chemotaxis protein
MAGFVGGDSKINFESASVMLIDPRPHSRNILLQIFRGFGVHAPLAHAGAAEAMVALKTTSVDLIVVEGDMADMDGYAFTKALRHSNLDPNRYAPVIITTGHTPQSKIKQARDCGANFVVAKALNPKTLLDRITWIAEVNRPFIEADGYIGPERRFQRLGPPAGMKARRKDDLTEDLGEATSPNLSQADIDKFVKPQRASL